jgi:hypothetical protein
LEIQLEKVGTAVVTFHAVGLEMPAKAWPPELSMTAVESIRI